MSSSIDAWAEDFYGKEKLAVAFNAGKARKNLKKKKPPIELRIIRDRRQK